jgi:hypothetical protein
MNELKRRIGRREAVRIAIVGALAILAGCADTSKPLKGTAANNRKDKKRQAMLVKVRNGYAAMPPSATIRRMEKSAAKKFAM